MKNQGSMADLPLDNNALACTYAALILHDEGLEIDASKILKLTQAAEVEVEGFWPGLFAKTLARQDMNKLLTTISGGGPAGGGGGGGGGGAAAPAAGGGAAPAKEEKKKAEPEPEEDEDMGFSLFD
eukprot:CAMPEP_0196723244 /NCGR_PEP_ID=MMETSP1091-20130531/5380_1 /TAXON_ID=302021 /ORGANISM="Rhodomonas sp., Strain CCMP768" /LENGTH=125 /DNA_ID=CAMNT_0042065097 /DNA_START=14 /DNA_END=391 /DNA_ORIENTATION=+